MRRFVFYVLLAFTGAWLLNVYLAFRESSPPSYHCTQWLLASVFGIVFQWLITIRLPVFRKYYQSTTAADMPNGKAAMVLSSLLAGCCAAMVWFLLGADSSVITRMGFNAAISAGIFSNYCTKPPKVL